MINREEPPYLQVARHYRQRIERGDRRPSQLLPSVRAMALKVLQAEGLVQSTSGAGTVVAQPAPTSDQATALNIGVGDPVLIERHWWSDENGLVLDYSESVELRER
ncbi:MAG: hypothetical protein JO272_06470 [Pseudonocardiales bacterium]|nr:hypothetical protein [Pseudonocardiales bacterium]